MPTSHTPTRCPACQGPLHPTVLTCSQCQVEVHGRFVINEFARLDADELHFLRIFIHCEGKIRDMETALGVSYPTIKARMTALKNQLKQLQTVPPTEPNPQPPAASVPGEASPAVPAVSTQEVNPILARLASGEITFEQAKALIRQTKQGV